MRIMKPLSVFMVCGILFFCLPCNAPTQQRVMDYSVVVSQAALKQLIDTQKNILIIDVSPSSSYHRGHIPRAKNFEFPDAIINMDQWNTSVMGGKSKEDFIGLLGENKDRPIVFYCMADWSSRSRNAASWAVNLGYKRVYRFIGGLASWVLSYPLEK